MRFACVGLLIALPVVSAMRIKSQLLAHPAEPYTEKEGEAEFPQLCFGNLHTWVSHATVCGDGGNPLDEDAGCTIPSYTSAWTGVHWNVADAPLDRLVNGYDSCPYDENKQFPIPDFCSRAIVAELGQIYDGEHRVAKTGSFWKNLGSSNSSTCGERKKPTEQIFSLSRNSQACWGFTAAYKDLYCTVYSKCASEYIPNTDGDKINCCKQLWSERVNRYKEAGLYEKMRELPRRTFEIAPEHMYHPPDEDDEHEVHAQAPGIVGKVVQSAQVSQSSRFW